MPTYKPRSVTEEPRSVLRRWRVFEVEIKGLETTRHFVGFNMMTSDGRVSSPIQTYEALIHTGVTRSGRKYELEGEPGLDMESLYVWRQWCRFNGIDPEIAKDVSEEYL